MKKQTASDVTNPQESPLPARDIGPAVGNQNQPQLDKRNAIADAADELRKEEMGPVDGADEARVLETAEEETEETTSEISAETKAKGGEDDTQVIEQPKKFKVPVLGKMKEMTEDELIATAAKVESADEYLRLASDGVKKAATTALSSDETVSEEEDFRALAKALQVGTEEEAEQALRDLVKKVTAKPSKTPDVSQVVDERLTLREEKAKFDKEFEAELKDDMLRKLILDRDTELSKEKPDMAPFERWRVAANEVRAWRNGFSPVQTSKAARKAQSSAPVKAASQQQTTSEDESELDDQAYIRQLAEKRGQGRPISH